LTLSRRKFVRFNPAATISEEPRHSRSPPTMMIADRRAGRDQMTDASIGARVQLREYVQNEQTNRKCGEIDAKMRGGVGSPQGVAAD